MRTAYRVLAYLLALSVAVPGVADYVRRRVRPVPGRRSSRLPCDTGPAPGSAAADQVAGPTAGAFLASMLLALLTTWDGQPGLNTVANALSAVVPLFGIPAAIAIAILKHQLYDIDRIISRTLSYAIVTGLLVGVYAGLVLLTTQVLSFSSPVAVATSALAAAALFSPLRNRVQQAADRSSTGPATTLTGRSRRSPPDCKGRRHRRGPRRPARHREPDPGTCPALALAELWSGRRHPGWPSARSPDQRPTGRTRGVLMNATAQQTEPNTHEMVVIHRIFRLEFPLLAGIVPRASDGDARRAAPIARHIGFCLDGLHNHHSAEDEYLWPALLERARPHAELVRGWKSSTRPWPAQRASEAADRTLAGHPRPPEGNRARDALSALSSALAEHLDEEEVSITERARPPCSGRLRPRWLRRRDGSACSAWILWFRSAHRHPPQARIPPAGDRVSPRVQRLRVRELRCRAEGVGPARGPPRGGTPRARPGRPVRRPHQADPRHVRRSARVWVLATSILLLAGRLTARADQPGPA